MEIIKLIGVLIVVIGFILKLDTLAVVVTAGLATGLVAGMTPMEILNTLGTAFITNRTATLFILTLPVIGLCERNGLSRLYQVLKKCHNRPAHRHLAGHPYCGICIFTPYRRTPPVYPPADQSHGPGGGCGTV